MAIPNQAWCHHTVVLTLICMYRNVELAWVRVAVLVVLCADTNTVHNFNTVHIGMQKGKESTHKRNPFKN